MSEPSKGEKRPRPPDSMFEPNAELFSPDADCEQWIRSTFIEPDGVLFNPDHQHLQSAAIGIVWTTCTRMQHMRSVVGQAELPQFQGNRWSRERQIQQMMQWFGDVPDFLLTFDAHYAESCDDVAWCALVEHELYHCGHALDEFGTPKFKKDGMPVFAIRGHDVEEFVGVVRRYGPSRQVREMIEAAQDGPQASTTHIEGACGTCRANI